MQNEKTMKLEEETVDSLFEDDLPDNPNPEGGEGGEGGTTPPNTDPPVDPNGDPPSPGNSGTGDPDEGGEGGSGNEGGESGLDNMSGIERYLAKFDIEGGIIRFDDGSTQHFNELEPGKQEEILEQLHNQTARSIEEKYGLDKTEIEFLNEFRKSKKPLDDYLRDIASTRFAETTSEHAGVDIESMSDEDIYKAFVKSENSDITDEQLTEDFEAASRLSTFDNLVDNMRKQLTTQQQMDLEAARQKAFEKQQRELEDDRNRILETIVPLRDIDGIQLNDNIKNEVLSKVLEVQEDGDSLFYDEVFSDPQKLFQAAFWFYNGPQLLQQRDAYWKKEKSAAFKRGMEKALGGSTPPVSFTSTSKPGTRSNPDLETFTQDELFDD
jgi:inhibitor of KinA sporulation pathway (predicted exonuclease)